ncbi:unnamed protein product [Arabidopsis lyrata]|nr:unnamed protein product [Arabidopsis lyrata]
MDGTCESSTTCTLPDYGDIISVNLGSHTIVSVFPARRSYENLNIY